MINWIWTDHILRQMQERNISRSIILNVLENPDEIVIGHFERKIYQKIIADKLVRIIAEGRTLVTVYATSKIRKYLKE